MAPIHLKNPLLSAFLKPTNISFPSLPVGKTGKAEKQDEREKFKTGRKFFSWVSGYSATQASHKKYSQSANFHLKEKMVALE